MSERISDSLLQGTIDWASVDSSTRHITSALRELQRYRELEKELRALADRMEWGDCPSYWLDPIESLLAALGSAQPEVKS